MMGRSDNGCARGRGTGRCLQTLAGHALSTHIFSERLSMMYLRSIVFAVASTFFIASAMADQDLAAVVKTKGRAWEAALGAGDINGLTAMYEDNAWFVVPGAPPFKGRDAVRSALEGFQKGTSSISLTTTGVEQIGPDYILETGTAKTVARGAKSSEASSTSYKILWHYTANDGWRISRDIVIAG